MTIRITCINKDNGDHYDPFEAISHLGWIEESTGKTGKNTRLEIVKFLEEGHKAYVRGMYGDVVDLVVRVSQAGNKYVKTIADGRETNNLLELLECK